MPAPAPAPAGDARPPKKSLRKLFLLAVLALLLVGGAGAGAYVYFGKKKSADEEDTEAKAAPAKNPPVFVVMEPLVVNLADPGGDRMVQMGITIQVVDQKTADLIKVYMPAIRGKVLILVSQRSAAELLQRDGKEKLATAILREVGLPLGIVPAEPEAAAPAAADPAPAAADDDEPKPKKKKKKAPAPPSPVQSVLFTSFIIQ